MTGQELRQLISEGLRGEPTMQGSQLVAQIKVVAQPDGCSLRVECWTCDKFVISIERSKERRPTMSEKKTPMETCRHLQDRFPGWHISADFDCPMPFVMAARRATDASPFGDAEDDVHQFTRKTPQAALRAMASLLGQIEPYLEDLK